MEAAILARDGCACLDRQEYRFDDDRSKTTTAYSSQKDNVSPVLSPPFSDSPGSTSSQEGSILSTKPCTTYRGIKTGSEKRFKCELQGCPYSASRRDHVRSHFKAHHDGNPFECSQWYAYLPGFLISFTHGKIFSHKTYVYPGDLHSHAPCNTQGKELRALCTKWYVQNFYLYHN